MVSVGQPRSKLARESFEPWTATHFIQRFACESGLIRDDTINIEIKLMPHIFDSVHGPRINLLAALVSLPNETAVETVLLHAKEIDI